MPAAVPAAAVPLDAMHPGEAVHSRKVADHGNVMHRGRVMRHKVTPPRGAESMRVGRTGAERRGRGGESEHEDHQKFAYHGMLLRRFPCLQL
jgi:hypothetical protein